MSVSPLRSVLARAPGQLLDGGVQPDRDCVRALSWPHLWDAVRVRKRAMCWPAQVPAHSGWASTSLVPQNPPGHLPDSQVWLGPWAPGLHSPAGCLCSAFESSGSGPSWVSSLIPAHALVPFLCQQRGPCSPLCSPACHCDSVSPSPHNLSLMCSSGGLPWLP